MHRSWPPYPPKGEIAQWKHFPTKVVVPVNRPCDELCLPTYPWTTHDQCWNPNRFTKVRVPTDLTKYFSMTFPWPSFFPILHLRRFTENIGKWGLSRSLLNFLVVTKKKYKFGTIWRCKIGQIPWLITKFCDFWQIFHVPWLFHDHFHFPGLPVSVRTLKVLAVVQTEYISLFTSALVSHKGAKGPHHMIQITCTSKVICNFL